jgi:hypothetical protein
VSLGLSLWGSSAFELCESRNPRYRHSNEGEFSTQFDRHTFVSKCESKDSIVTMVSDLESLLSKFSAYVQQVQSGFIPVHPCLQCKVPKAQSASRRLAAFVPRTVPCEVLVVFVSHLVQGFNHGRHHECWPLPY